MTAIPEPIKSTAKKIHWLYEQKTELPRPHMGASIIGHACDRYIWQSWRWLFKEQFHGRILRLFETGQREEERMANNLRAIGVELYTHDPETGKQVSVTALNGHFAGSVDGIGRGFEEAPKSWAVLEVKTHNAKSYAELEKKGVKAAKPQHYSQMTVYMGLLEINRAMYLAQCKNTDEIYAEWVHFNKEDFTALMARAKSLIEAKAPPPGISSDPAWYECKWCGFYSVCHGSQLPLVNCRTCANSTPIENAQWRCESTGQVLSFNDQLAACDNHLFIPDLLTFAQPVDGGEHHVDYQVRGSELTFTNGRGGFSSRELFATPVAMIGDAGLNKIKDTFKGAQVVPLADMTDDLEEVYRENNSVKAKKTRAAIAQNTAILDSIGVNNV